jgi:hypothetical protein
MLTYILVCILSQTSPIEPDRYPNPYLCDCMVPFGTGEVESTLDKTSAEEAREAEAMRKINEVLADFDDWRRP